MSPIFRRGLDAELPSVIEDESSFPENQERAIVLFTIMIVPSICLNSDLVPSPSFPVIFHVFPSFVVVYDFLVQFLALKITWANDMELADIDVQENNSGCYSFITPITRLFS